MSHSNQTKTETTPFKTTDSTLTHRTEDLIFTTEPSAFANKQNNT